MTIIISTIIIWITCQLNILCIFLPVISCMGNCAHFLPHEALQCFWPWSLTAPASSGTRAALSPHTACSAPAPLRAPITCCKIQLTPSSYGKVDLSAWNRTWIPGLSPVPSIAARINKEEKKKSHIKMTWKWALRLCYCLIVYWVQEFCSIKFVYYSGLLHKCTIPRYFGKVTSHLAFYLSSIDIIAFKFVICCLEKMKVQFEPADICTCSLGSVGN